MAVAGARADVHDGRIAAAVFSAKTCRIDVSFLKNIRIKHREKSNAVEGIVQNHTVELDEVLDGCAASNVELTALVACGNDTGQYLQGPHQIRLPTNGEGGDGFGAQLHHGSGNLGLLFLALDVNDHVFEDDRGFFQQKALKTDSARLDANAARDVLEARHFDRHVVRAHGNAIDLEVAVRIGVGRKRLGQARFGIRIYNH